MLTNYLEYFVLNTSECLNLLLTLDKKKGLEQFYFVQTTPVLAKTDCSNVSPEIAMEK